MSSSGDYGPPSDPWGEAPDVWDPAAGTWRQPAGAGHGAPTGAPVPGAGPGPGRPGAGPGSAYPPPPPPHTDVPFRPPPPRRNLGLYAVVAVLVLLAAAGAGYALYLLSGDDGDAGANPTPGVTATGGATGTPGPSGSPPDRIGLSAAAARADDCLVNEGTTDQTQMRIVRCDGDDLPDAAVVFRVLAVVDEQVTGEDGDARHLSAQQICAEVDGYTHHYFEIGDEASFVLCMARE
ncbi:MAG: hypothetical protein GEV12_17010 [Micromonosporaceae bacterium]|nr:hypothetical protein [Micromonosporaceae bacterium]